MPLLRLLPGLPRRSFSSWTGFFGAIFLDFAYVRIVVRMLRNEGENSAEWSVAENSRAVLAAGREKAGITEEKERARGLAGGVVVEGLQRDDFAASLLCGALRAWAWAAGPGVAAGQFSTSSPLLT